MTREHDWMRTYSGLQFYPFDPQPEMICIEDIAHALSMLCRYTGHVRKFYSVAEHSVLVTGIVAERVTKLRLPRGELRNVLRWALLHDAAEAYVGDMGRPLKHQPEMQLYRETEKRVERAIALRFGLAGEEPALVTAVDKEIIGSEARLLKWGESLATVYPLPPMISTLRHGVIGASPEKAEGAFLDMWDSLERSDDGLLRLAQQMDAVGRA